MATLSLTQLYLGAATGSNITKPKELSWTEDNVVPVIGASAIAPYRFTGSFLDADNKTILLQTGTVYSAKNSNYEKVFGEDSLQYLVLMPMTLTVTSTDPSLGIVLQSYGLVALSNKVIILNNAAVYKLSFTTTVSGVTTNRYIYVWRLSDGSWIASLLGPYVDFASSSPVMPKIAYCQSSTTTMYRPEITASSWTIYNNQYSGLEEATALSKMTLTFSTGTTRFAGVVGISYATAICAALTNGELAYVANEAVGLTS